MAAGLAELCLPTVIACLAAVVAAEPFADGVPASVPNTAVVPPASSITTLPAVVAAPVAAAVVAIEVVPPASLTNIVDAVVPPAVTPATITCTSVQLTGDIEMLLMIVGTHVGSKVGKSVVGPIVGSRLGANVGYIEVGTIVGSNVRVAFVAFAPTK